MKILYFVLTSLLFACSGGLPTPSKCGEEKLAAITLECKLRVERECKDVPDSECPVITECDKLVDEWETCK